MNRRQFLKTAGTAMGAASLGLPLPALSKPAMALRLTLLHTNDVHSHLAPVEGGEHDGLGGAAARAMLASRVREQHENVLLLDAGDIFQGTSYFNLFLGEPDFKAMNAMGYDAATIGNHDFDAGIERLAELTRGTAKFPLLNCNYDFTNTPMQGLTKPSIVREFAGLKVGLIGVGIELEGLVLASLYGETTYHDPIESVRREARRLKNDEGCEFIVVLSHINVNSRKGKEPDTEPGDRDLIVAVPEVDVIIGGHNHYFFEKPLKLRRRGASPGYINQMGWAGTHMGLMQFDIYDDSRRDLALGKPAKATLRAVA